MLTPVTSARSADLRFSRVPPLEKFTRAASIRRGDPELDRVLVRARTPDEQTVLLQAHDGVHLILESAEGGQQA